MTNRALVPSLRLRAALLRAAALVLACLSLGAVPALAPAQSIMQQPQTKEQAKQAQEAADKAASSSSSGSSDSSLTIGLLVLGAGLLGGAAWWIVRDSSDSVRDDARRAAPGRPLTGDAVGRGAPRAMFTGEGEPGGKTGKRRKREQGKRQRQARKANRPR